MRNFTNILFRITFFYFELSHQLWVDQNIDTNWIYFGFLSHRFSPSKESNFSIKVNVLHFWKEKFLSNFLYQNPFVCRFACPLHHVFGHCDSLMTRIDFIDYKLARKLDTFLKFQAKNNFPEKVKSVSALLFRGPALCRFVCPLHHVFGHCD